MQPVKRCCSCSKVGQPALTCCLLHDATNIQITTALVRLLLLAPWHSPVCLLQQIIQLLQAWRQHCSPRCCCCTAALFSAAGCQLLLQWLEVQQHILLLLRLQAEVLLGHIMWCCHDVGTTEHAAVEQQQTCEQGNSTCIQESEGLVGLECV